MKRSRFCALLCAALILALLLSFAPMSFAADGSFEKSIADFPESYRVKLRELHTVYPNWEFQAIDTGLDWDAAVNTESSGGRSLVDISENYSYLFKSKNTGDYDYSSSRYIAKDGGFCAANKFCVSYFMDPRNFLTEENIFQFELLSFDESFTVAAVDLVLSGTFMYNKKITYVTDSGESRTMNETYAEVIFQAGKTYDANPCFLASKIRSEIGSSPSGSVTGRNSTYPGIYNFYNIGASDGAGAITRGLAWAANGKDGTYGRPWTDPKKSIMGGAEFLVNTYIGKGQFTGYYQRFNVNPHGYYQVYSHQYMTNISGAAEQGYSTYRSYLSMGLLQQRFIFSLPVYRNMPGASNYAGTLKLNDASSQTVKVSTTSAINVRTGPSTYNDRLAFTVSPGTSMTVLGVSFTDSRYPDSILKYPVWYYVKFQYEGTAYKGYVPAQFTTAVSVVTVAPGLYAPKYSTGNRSLYFRYVSLDARMCSVVDETRLNFLKEGVCDVLAYDSSGRAAVVRYKISSSAPANEIGEPGRVTDSGPGQVTGLQQTNVTESGFTLQWNALSGATGYRIYRFNPERGKNDVVTTTKKTAYTFKNLAAGSVLELRVKAYSKSSGKTVWGQVSAPLRAKTVPSGPENLSQTASSSASVTLSWSGVDGAKTYQVVRYDDDKNDFVPVQSTEGHSLNVSGLLPASSYWFKVRAVVSIGGKNYYTPFSLTLTAMTGPEPVRGLKQSAADEKSITLRWDTCPNADGYIVYRRSASSGALIEVGETSFNTFTVEGLSPGQSGEYSVKAYLEADGFRYAGSEGGALFATTKPAAVVGVRQYSTKRTCFKLTWSPVKNATGYCVYRVNAAGSHKKLANVTNNKALIKGLSPGTGYDLVVRAYIRAEGKVYWGAYSSVYTARTKSE